MFLGKGSKVGGFGSSSSSSSFAFFLSSVSWDVLFACCNDGDEEAKMSKVNNCGSKGVNFGDIVVCDGWVEL